MFIYYKKCPCITTGEGYFNLIIIYGLVKMKLTVKILLDIYIYRKL